MMQYSLSKLVKKEYLKSIIYPLLLIEAMLLGAYFWSNAYVNTATQNTLIEESKVHIKEISKRSATIINSEFKAISDITLLFQKEHENFFASYNPSLIINKDSSYSVTDTGVITNTKKERTLVRYFSPMFKNKNLIGLKKLLLRKNWMLFTMPF